MLITFQILIFLGCDKNGGPTAAGGEAAADHLLLERKVGEERKGEERVRAGLTLPTSYTKSSSVTE
jgi:hypothetical protein